MQTQTFKLNGTDVEIAEPTAQQRWSILSEVERISFFTAGVKSQQASKPLLFRLILEILAPDKFTLYDPTATDWKEVSTKHDAVIAADFGPINEWMKGFTAMAELEPEAPKRAKGERQDDFEKRLKEHKEKTKNFWEV